MPHPNDIPEMEKALAERSITIAALCRRSEIAATTWTRWKSGKVSPTVRVWDAVVQAFRDLIREHDQKHSLKTPEEIAQ